MKEKIILLLLLAFSATTNLFIFNNVSFLYFREIFASIYLLFVPGLLLSWTLKLNVKNIWELMTYTVGLSIASLMLLGLSINLLLPLINVSMPLSTGFSLITVDFWFLFFWLYLFTNTIPPPLTGSLKRVSIKNVVLATVSIAFPILSIVGAIQLNNQQTNIFSMIMLGSIAIYVLLLTALKDRINKHIYPFTLFMISLSLLFMTSLRGWFVTGHDVFLEQYVFQLTKSNGIWDIVNFHDPYNACLSITILPTILANITGINDFYIFKILYQIIFSFSVLGTYLFIKRFLNSILSFLGTFAIISLPTFMTDMPMLNRQEIALFFFVLLLNTFFQHKISTQNKWLLFLLFGSGLLFSHYATTYLTVGLLVTTAIGYLLIRLIMKHNHIKKVTKRLDRKFGITHNRPNIHIGMTILLLVCTTFWYGTYTDTEEGIVETIIQIGKDISTTEIDTEKSDPAAYGLLAGQAPSKELLLQNHITETSAHVRKFNDESAFIDKAIVKDYPVTVGSQVTLPLTSFGETLAKWNINSFTLNSELKELYAKTIQIFIIIGFIAMFFYRRHLKKLEKEYLILAIIFFILLVLQSVLPGGSINYGILRLFQQGLILFIIPLLMGAFFVFGIFNRINPNIKVYLSAFTFVFFFLYLSGFIPTTTGGYYPQMNLSNAGFYHDAYYTHTKDKIGIDWIGNNRNTEIPVQSDWFALKKIHTYENFYSIDGLIPSVIRKDSYIYLSVSNMQTGNVIIYANGAPLYYKLPLDFYDDNKNLIYNNGGSRIYR